MAFSHFVIKETENTWLAKQQQWQQQTFHWSAYLVPQIPTLQCTPCEVYSSKIVSKESNAVSSQLTNTLMYLRHWYTCVPRRNQVSGRMNEMEDFHVCSRSETLVTKFFITLGNVTTVN